MFILLEHGENCSAITSMLNFIGFYHIFLPFGLQCVLLYIYFISFKIEVLFHYNIVK